MFAFRLFFFVSLFIFTSQSLFSQKVKPENQTDMVRLYWDAQKRHINSKGSYYVDEIIGETKEKHGKWKFYDFNGVLTEERNYFRDRIHGKQLAYYSNKKLKSESFFKFNVPDSSLKEWSKEGTMVVEGNYTLGSPDGDWKYFFDDGRLEKREYISNDTIYLIELYEQDSTHTPIIENGNGEIKKYYVSGGLKEFYTYTNGLQTGPFEERLANGIITVRGQFTHGLKDGTWYFYSPLGEIQEINSYHLDTLHGIYETYFPNGIQKTKGEYKKGKKHGAWSWTTENKKPEMIGSFIDGDQDGEWKYYFSSGELSYVAHFKKGLRTGNWMYYFSDGSTYKKGSYKNDQKSGLWITNYEDGKTLMKGSYVNGLENGEWLNYWDNGKLKNKAFFKSGKLNGIWNSFSPEGILLLSGTYKNGLKVKEWKTFDNKGRLLSLENYKIVKDDQESSEIVVIGRSTPISVLHGKFEAYSEVDYTLKATGKYKNGKKNGTFVDYYPGGVVPTIVAQYKNGKLDGLFQQFSRQGGIRHQIQYKNGLKNGSFLIFNSSKQVVIRKEFLNGIEIKR